MHSGGDGADIAVTGKYFETALVSQTILKEDIFGYYVRILLIPIVSLGYMVAAVYDLYLAYRISKRKIDDVSFSFRNKRFLAYIIFGVLLLSASGFQSYLLLFRLNAGSPPV